LVIIKSQGKLYDDDGITPEAFENEKYEILYFSGEINTGQIVVNLTSETGIDYKSKNRKMELIIYNLQSEPTEVKINGKNHNSDWNAGTGTLSIDFTWKADLEQSITIFTE